jgi:formylglycine-generating enzyme required for sulfatase activity
VAGEYTLVWENLSGWVPPDPEELLLLGGGSITFAGLYVEEEALPGFRLLPPAQVPMPATFTMGSDVEPEETPHQVTLTHRFYLGETEVTNGQYVQLLQWAFDRFYVTADPYAVRDNMDSGTAVLVDLDDQDCQIDFSNGAFSTPYPDRPVIDLSWYGAAAYCDWLSMYEGLPRAYNHYNWRCNNFDPYGAVGYRLPTEAEWEFSCRAGTLGHYYTGDCLDSGTEANYNGLYPFGACPSGPAVGHTVDVASYPPNPWGLYDMHGNVYEWCNDRLGDYDGDVIDPVGPTVTGINRIVRGGGFSFEGAYCRSAARGDWAPNYFAAATGFRVARTAQ